MTTHDTTTSIPACSEAGGCKWHVDGKCRRFPPLLVTARNGTYQPDYPVSVDGCGEHTAFARPLRPMSKAEAERAQAVIREVFADVEARKDAAVADAKRRVAGGFSEKVVEAATLMSRARDAAQGDAAPKRCEVCTDDESRAPWHGDRDALVKLYHVLDPNKIERLVEWLSSGTSARPESDPNILTDLTRASAILSRWDATIGEASADDDDNDNEALDAGNEMIAGFIRVCESADFRGPGQGLRLRKADKGGVEWEATYWFDGDDAASVVAHGPDAEEVCRLATDAIHEISARAEAAKAESAPAQEGGGA